MNSAHLTIVSGGQTGADRAALDWAIERGIPHGGFCPAGRMAEDGPRVHEAGDAAAGVQAGQRLWGGSGAEGWKG